MLQSKNILQALPFELPKFVPVNVATIPPSDGATFGLVFINIISAIIL